MREIVFKPIVRDISPEKVEKLLEDGKKILTKLAQAILVKINKYQGSFIWGLKQEIDSENRSCRLLLSITIRSRKTGLTIKHLENIVYVENNTPHYTGGYYELIDEPFESIVDLIVRDLQ